MSPAAVVIDFPDALPAPLPQDERVLWQGRPDGWALARDALHIRGLAAYAALLVASVATAAAWRGAPAAEVALDAARATAFAAIPLAIALVYAWLAARAARYVITNRRVVLRVGAALPISINLPFARIASAGLRTRGATGEIALKLVARDGLAAIMLWPHAPFGRAEPTLRGLPNAAHAGQVLSQALAASENVPIPVSPTVSLAKASTSVDTAAPSRGKQTVAA